MAKRSRSVPDLVDTYLRGVIDLAAKVNTPAFDRLALAADALRAKAREPSGPNPGIAEAMGAAPQSSGTAPSNTVAEGVLRRSAEALATLGDDISPQTIMVGLRAAAHVIRERARSAHGEGNLALIATASLAPARICHPVAPFALAHEPEADA